jgi:aryl-alcohol dehydrogenase-like predicted oxidoreductase
LVDNICIGTAQFGMLYGIANKSGQPGADEVLSIVKLASENNVWFYDTAQAYGDSENLLGKAFSQLRVNDRVRCITKIHPNMKDRDVDTLIQLVRESMQRLQVSQLWGLLAHRVEQVRDSRTLKAVDRMKKEGLIKFWGATVYDPKDAMDLTRELSIDIIQVPFNMLDRRLLDCDFFKAAREHGKKVFLRSIFLQGLLFLEAKELSQKGMGWAKPQLEDFRNRINALNIPLGSFAMQAVSTVIADGVMIMGIEKASQLEKNLNALRSPLIAKDLVDNWWKNLPDYPERLLNPSVW